MARTIKKFANKDEKLEEASEGTEVPVEEAVETTDEDVSSTSEPTVGSPTNDVVTKEVTNINNEGVEEHTLKITPSATTEAVVVDTGTKFSDLSDEKVNLVDFYQDTRTFLAKANSTKFILVAFLMLTIPGLLIYGYISPDIYKDMVILLAVSYLGVDVYEKKSMIKR